MMVTGLKLTCQDTATGRQIEIASSAVVELEIDTFEDHEIRIFEHLNTRKVTLTLEVGSFNSDLTIDVESE